MRFNAGKYYIGDPCYVIHDDNWDKLIDDTNCFGNEEQSYKGKQILCGGTAYGDGCYLGSNGKEYGVDAGLIGIIPIEVIDVNVEDAERDGSVEEFKYDFNVYIDDGIFEFDNITIDTRYCDDYYEYDEYDEYDGEYDDDEDCGDEDDYEDADSNDYSVNDLDGWEKPDYGSY